MRKYLGASEGSFVYILGLCAGSLLSSMLMNFVMITGSFQGMNIMSWVGYVIPQVAFILVFVVYGMLRRVDMRFIARVRKPANPRQWILLPFISIAAIILFLPLSDLFLKLLGAMGFNGSVSMPTYDNVGVYFLSLLIMAVLPAIGEEFICRGALFSGLSTRSTWFGILISALLFSLMHANAVQTVHQFGLGVVLAIVLLLTGSIWACVFIHFFNNFISITLNAYIPQIDEWLFSIGNWTILTDIIAVIVGFVLMCVLLYLLYRMRDPKKKMGYRVVTDGIVYEEFAIYATPDEKIRDRKYKFGNSLFADTWRFFGSLFTKRGWQNVTYELNQRNDAPFLGKAQPMLNVWLAIGFGVFYWLINFIFGFID